MKKRLDKKEAAQRITNFLALYFDVDKRIVTARRSMRYLSDRMSIPERRFHTSCCLPFECEDHFGIRLTDLTFEKLQREEITVEGVIRLLRNHI